MSSLTTKVESIDPGTMSELGTAASLTADDFPKFFHDIHGYAPFPWQQRLTKQVLEHGAWPTVIDLPTGTGKTAVLDTAVFTLAVRPTLFPRRIVFVIDRRIVVDQVCKRAQRIQERIEAGGTTTLQHVRNRLRALSEGKALGVAALRGGIPIDNTWTHLPDQPWVMVSTIDQFGSRLLFRGYGVTSGMRPIHAGLAGNDCLVILDEVHLSVPFAKTLAQVATLRSQQNRLPRRFGVVTMSATPFDTDTKPFTLDPISDLTECEELRRRIEAAKQASLQSVRNHDEVPNTVLKIVKKIMKSHTSSQTQTIVHSVGVVVNRVRTSRETFKILQEAGITVHLLTGRMRPLDKVEVLRQITPLVDPEGKYIESGLVVVVATQAIEVGADFSFDALITECAAVDSLRQRFGRLDRRGLWAAQAGTAAQAWIIGPKSVVTSKKPDPIYGNSVKVTWKELERRCAESGTVDVGPRSLANFPKDARAPQADAPLLLKTHMDAWTQTSPEPIVQPSIEWFLHGIDPERSISPDVSILWRWDRSLDVLQLVPPRQTEFLQVPIHAVKSWLSGNLEAEEVDVSDVAQGWSKADDAPAFKGNDRPDWVRWGGFEKGPEEISISEIRPGDILIVNPSRGGLSSGTWDPASTDIVADLGDAAQIADGRKVTLRLSGHLPLVTAPPRPSEEINASVSPRERLFSWLKDQLDVPSNCPDWFTAAVKRLSRDGTKNDNFEIRPVGLNNDSGDASYYILTERQAGTKHDVVDPAILDGSDSSSSLIGTGVSLDCHLKGVAERARKIAKRLGLDAQLVNDLHLAGRLHDLGKVDRRFQEKLVGGDPVALEMLEEPLAKSLPGVYPARRCPDRYPDGMRHEIASVALIESNRDVLGSAHDRDLVLHLVGTHHGRGRPLPPIVKDWEPQELSYAVDGHRLGVCSDLADSSMALVMADRFWRLVRRYGYHGLAWLESILRLADHQQSAKEAQGS